jgi:DNA-binding response OmpR family regulator
MNRKILVIEDDEDIARLVAAHLEELGLKVTLAGDGRRGRELALAGGYDLIVLDLMLPGLDGLELCRELRRTDAQTLVLMLTCKSSECDRVLGIELGADDYLTKPFSIRELQARVKALFRRVEDRAAGQHEEEPVRLRRGALILDAERRQVLLDDRQIELTRREFDLLWCFARHPGRVFSRGQLLERVWGYGYQGYDHTVNSHVNRLRTKIERDPARPRIICTVWGVGYRFEQPGEDD